MKHLIVYCHPNPQSFNHAILTELSTALREAGHELRVRDLYALEFDPVLKGSDLASIQDGDIPADIRAEQQQVSWADVITFVFPLWWAGMPALAKGYLDRVLSDGFAYRFDAEGHHRLLTGKKVFTITTVGDTEETYRSRGFFEAMDRLMDEITCDFAGLQPIGHKYFCAIEPAGDAARRAMLDEVRALAAEIG